MRLMVPYINAPHINIYKTRQKKCKFVSNLNYTWTVINYFLSKHWFFSLLYSRKLWPYMSLAAFLNREISRSPLCQVLIQTSTTSNCPNCYALMKTLHRLTKSIIGQTLFNDMNKQLLNPYRDQAYFLWTL